MRSGRGVAEGLACFPHIGGGGGWREVRTVTRDSGTEPPAPIEMGWTGHASDNNRQAAVCPETAPNS